MISSLDLREMDGQGMRLKKKETDQDWKLIISLRITRCEDVEVETMFFTLWRSLSTYVITFTFIDCKEGIHALRKIGTF